MASLLYEEGGFFYVGEEEGTIRSIGAHNRVPEAGKTEVLKAL